MRQLVLETIACVLVPGLLVAQEVAQSEVLDVEVVNVDVYATDKRGNRVTDLVASDFQILEDGKKVNVDYFTHFQEGAGVESRAALSPRESLPGADLPRVETLPASRVQLVVLVDNENSRRGAKERLLEEVGDVLAGRPASVMVTTYEGGRLEVVQPFTEDEAVWTAALDAVNVAGGRQAMQGMERRAMIDEIEPIIAGLAAGGSNSAGSAGQLKMLTSTVRMHAQETHNYGRRTLSAIEGLVVALGAVPERKSVLYVGDGFPLMPGLELYNLVAHAFGNDPRLRPTGVSDVSSSGFGGGSSGGSGSSGGGGGGGSAGGGGGGGGSSGGGGSGGDAGGSSGGSGGGGSTGGGGTGNSFGSSSSSGSTSLASFQMEAQRFDLSAQVRQLTAKANTSRVSFYAASSVRIESGVDAQLRFGSAELPGFYADFRTNRENTLHQMSDETAGRLMSSGGDVEGLVDDLFRDRGNYYFLGYDPPQRKAKKKRSPFHRIKVKVKRKGVRLRHRQGYVEREVGTGIEELLVASLVLGYEDNPHDFELDVIPGDASARSLHIIIPIDSMALEAGSDGVHRAKLELSILGQTDDSHFTTLQQVPLIVEVASDLLERASGQLYQVAMPLPDEGAPAKIAMSLWEAAAGRRSLVNIDIAKEGEGIGAQR